MALRERILQFRLNENGPLEAWWRELIVVLCDRAAGFNWAYEVASYMSYETGGLKGCGRVCGFSADESRCWAPRCVVLESFVGKEGGRSMDIAAQCR